MILSVCPNPSVDTYWFLNGLEAGESHRIQEEMPFPGGKGVHVALAVAEMGLPSTLLGFWAGSSGEWLKEECQKQGIICEGEQLEGNNRTCLTFRLENSPWHDTEFLGLGPILNEDKYQAFITSYKKLLDQTKVVVLSGSWPANAPDDPYGLLIDLANEKQIPVWLDCSGENLSKALLHKPYGLHLNKKEALEGVPATFQGKMEDYYLQYAQKLAFTAGKDGLFLYDQTGCTQAICRLEDIISAVGSGDCLTAGVAMAQYLGLDNKEIARLGTACGSANCLRPDLGMLYRSDVERLKENVVLKVLNSDYCNQLT